MNRQSWCVYFFLFLLLFVMFIRVHSMSSRIAGQAERKSSCCTGKCSKNGKEQFPTEKLFCRTAPRQHRKFGRQRVFCCRCSFIQCIICLGQTARCKVNPSATCKNFGGRKCRVTQTISGYEIDLKVYCAFGLVGVQGQGIWFG